MSASPSLQCPVHGFESFEGQPGEVKAGRLADANLFRFSSKELHAASGLYYYGYRFYEPSLQRWINVDPLGELAGANPHRIVFNSPTLVLDSFGLDIVLDKGEGPEQAGRWLRCWRNELPKDSKLRRLIDDLDRKGQTTTVCPLTGRVGANGEQCPTPYGEQTFKDSYKMFIDASGYYFNNDPRNKYYTFPEGLIHELLHAHDDMIKKNHRKHGEGFWDDQAEMLKELEELLKKK